MILRYIFILHSLVATINIIFAENLKSGRYEIIQSWSQENSFPRPFWVRVPSSMEGRVLPLFIFLHGNGGNAENAQGIVRRYKNVANNYIMVFAQGYQRSWNIVSERSKAPDREFIEAVVTNLIDYSNVKTGGVVLMGSSNGAALVNQIAIETRLNYFSHYITLVSQLNDWQHDGSFFKAKGNENNYTKSILPLKGKRLMNISGENDKLVPYAGGSSTGIRAKDGKLHFLDAELSTFLWAQHYGYSGKQLTQPSEVRDKYDTYSYMNGSVVHYKMKNRAHNAGGDLTEDMLSEFLKN